MLKHFLRYLSHFGLITSLKALLNNGANPNTIYSTDEGKKHTCIEVTKMMCNDGSCDNRIYILRQHGAHLTLSDSLAGDGIWDLFDQDL